MGQSKVHMQAIQTKWFLKAERGTDKGTYGQCDKVIYVILE